MVGIQWLQSIEREPRPLDTASHTVGIGPSVESTGHRPGKRSPDLRASQNAPQ